MAGLGPRLLLAFELAGLLTVVLPEGLLTVVLPEGLAADVEYTAEGFGRVDEEFRLELFSAGLRLTEAGLVAAGFFDGAGLRAGVDLIGRFFAGLCGLTAGAGRCVCLLLTTTTGSGRCECLLLTTTTGAGRCEWWLSMTTTGAGGGGVLSITTTGAGAGGGGGGATTTAGAGSTTTGAGATT